MSEFEVEAVVEEEEAIPDELEIAEFMALSEERPPRGKVDESALLDFISSKAKTCSAIKKHFGVTYSAMLSRLNRLLEQGKVIRRYKEGRAYWLKKPAPTPAPI